MKQKIYYYNLELLTNRPSLPPFTLSFQDSLAVLHSCQATQNSRFGKDPYCSDRNTVILSMTLFPPSCRLCCARKNPVASPFGDPTHSRQFCNALVDFTYPITPVLLHRSRRKSCPAMAARHQICALLQASLRYASSALDQ